MGEKENTRRLLEAADFDALVRTTASGQLFRALTSLAYDKQDVVCWRAIEAVGLIAGAAAATTPEKVRTLVQRLLWMLRDESGNNITSAPEMLGEIVRNSPGAFADIAPIIGSFHDEMMLRPGVLYGILRIAQVAPELVHFSAFLANEYLSDPNPVVRAYALELAATIGVTALLPAVEKLLNDGAEVVLYRDRQLQPTTVGAVARETVRLLCEEGA